MEEIFNKTIARLRHIYETRGLCPDIAPLFQQAVYDIARQHPRKLPWRISPSPYTVFVSEIMLQQTQAKRVAEKFPSFIKAFPNFYTLSKADFHDVLRHWSGLGYNRRALSLHKSARIIVSNYRGILPANPDLLCRLPGIGPATACSICAFAFNMPVVFLETNIRAVLIHVFFHDVPKVADALLYPLAELCLDRSSPAGWYNALMDAGVVIKQLHKNPARKSWVYRRQSKFEGSRRQLRGKILQLIITEGSAREEIILRDLRDDPHMVKQCLIDLSREGFLVKDEKGNYALSDM